MSTKELQLPRDLSLLTNPSFFAFFDTSALALKFEWHNEATWTSDVTNQKCQLPNALTVALLGHLSKTQVQHTTPGYDPVGVFLNWYRQKAGDGYDWFLAITTTDSSDNPILMWSYRVFGPSVDETSLTSEQRVMRLIFTIAFGLPAPTNSFTCAQNNSDRDTTLGPLPVWTLGWEGQARGDTSVRRLSGEFDFSGLNVANLQLLKDSSYNSGDSDFSNEDVLIKLAQTIFQGTSSHHEIMWFDDQMPEPIRQVNKYLQYAFVAIPWKGKVRMYQGRRTQWGMVTEYASKDLAAMVATLAASIASIQRAVSLELIKNEVIDETIDVVGDARVMLSALIEALPSSESLQTMVEEAQSHIEGSIGSIPANLGLSSFCEPLLMSVLSLYRKKTGKTNYDKLVAGLRELRVKDAASIVVAQKLSEQNPSVIESVVSNLDAAGDPKNKKEAQ